MSEGQYLQVYFDQSCQMCRAEIAFYRKRSGAERIDWIDVSDPENVPGDLSCEVAMAQFHIRTPQGQLIVGGKAFAALWRHLPAFKWLGILFNLPGLRWIIDRAYVLFLPLRPRLQRFFANTA